MNKKLSLTSIIIFLLFLQAVIPITVYSQNTATEQKKSDSKMEAYLFSDINNHWAKETIVYLAEKGYIKGYLEGSGYVIRPDLCITRAEYLSVLIKSVGLPLIKEKVKVFSDVNDKDWFKETVDIASGNDILSGYPDGSFKPNNPITRAEIAALIVKVSNLSKLADQKSAEEFNDVNKDNWYYQSVMTCKENKIINGYPDGSFKPESIALRAEAFSIIFNYLKQHKNIVEEKNEEVPAVGVTPVATPVPVATPYITPTSTKKVDTGSAGHVSNGSSKSSSKPVVPTATPTKITNITPSPAYTVTPAVTPESEIKITLTNPDENNAELIACEGIYPIAGYVISNKELRNFKCELESVDDQGIKVRHMEKEIPLGQTVTASVYYSVYEKNELFISEWKINDSFIRPGSNNVYITFKDVSGAAASKDFTVKGLKRIKDIEPISAITVYKGKTPDLPSRTRVVYEDGTTGEVGLSWPSVDTSVIGEKEIEGSLVNYGTKVVVKVLVQKDDIDVVSIRYTNLLEFFIEFNKPMDRKSAEDLKNYEFNEEAFDYDSYAELQEDGKTVKITLGEPVPNETKMSVVIRSDIKDKDGNKMPEDKVYKMFATDYQRPEVVGLELIAPDVFKIVFSEPVDLEGSNATIVFEDNTYSVNIHEIPVKSEVNVILPVLELDEGDYKVEIKGFKDFAGNIAPYKELTLHYQKDTSEITAEVTDVTPKYAKIKFNKSIVDENGDRLSCDFFFHSDERYSAEEVSVNEEYNEYTLYFEDNILPEGNVIVGIKHELNGTAVKDLWGNKLESDILLHVNVVWDHEKPTIVKIETDNSGKETYIFFSEEVNNEDAENVDNYVFIRENREKILPQTLEYMYGQFVKVLFNEDLVGLNTVQISNIKDISPNSNVIDTVTKEFLVYDTTPIDIDYVTAYGKDGDTCDYIYVIYPEAMKEGSVLDIGNYFIRDDYGNTINFESRDKVSFLDKSRRKIQIVIQDENKYDVEDGNIKLSIGKVRDESGNSTKQLSFEVPVIAAPVPEILSIRTIESNKLEIRINVILSSISLEGIVLEKNNDFDYVQTTPAKASYITNDNGETIVTLTLRSLFKFENPADTNIRVMIHDGEIMSEFGVYMYSQTYTNILDGYAPSLLEFKDLGYKQPSFEMIFDEDLSSETFNNLDKFADELKIVDKDGKYLESSEDYYLSSSNSAGIVLTLTGDYEKYNGDLKVSTNESVKYAADASGNTLNPFADYRISVEEKE